MRSDFDNFVCSLEEISHDLAREFNSLSPNERKEVHNLLLKKMDTTDVTEKVSVLFREVREVIIKRKRTKKVVFSSVPVKKLIETPRSYPKSDYSKMTLNSDPDWRRSGGIALQIFKRKTGLYSVSTFLRTNKDYTREEWREKQEERFPGALLVITTEEERLK